MRSLITVCTIACVVLLAASFASAANPGQISHVSLSQMGLAGLQPMSDLEGGSLRGKGFVAAGGISIAAVPGAIDAHGSIAVGHSYASASSNASAYSSFGKYSSAYAWASGSASAVAH
jgi:hypothetical protein